MTVTCNISVDLGQALADINWQIAKGHLNAVVAAHGSRLRGGAFNEQETKYEKLQSLVGEFVDEVERLELHL